MTKRIAWFASFTAAATVALLMGVAGYDWLGTLGTAALSCVALADLMQDGAQSPLITDGVAGLRSNAAAAEAPVLRSAPNILERLWRHRRVAHGIGDRGMPEEVLESPCVHSSGCQCVSGRMPQHVNMDGEW
jgi:hypothetical protein